nr:hypothetical protein [Tanacetum cinerariifolium]
MIESEAYKTYYAYATGEKTPKPKYVQKKADFETSPKKKPVQAFKGKRLKVTAKVPKSGKKKLPAHGLETLLEIALSEAEQMKITTKRRKTQFHVSHVSNSGAHEGTSFKLGILDAPKYGSDDEQISWKSSDEDDDDEDTADDNADDEDDDGQDDDNEYTELDNDGDEFVHPKLSTFDEQEKRDEKLDEEEEGSDLRVQTPSHFESTDDVTQGDNVEEEKLDEVKINEEKEVNELYNDVNINLEGRDIEMTDALLPNVKATQVIKDTHVIMTAVTLEVQQQSSSVSSGFISNMLNPNPDVGIDSILNLNIDSTSLIDVLVTTHDEIPSLFVTTLPPLYTPLINPLQQTSVFTPIITPSTSLQNFPTFGSLFKFENRVKALEDDFSEFKQTNLFAEAVSLIPSIVDTYLANKMNEAVKTANIIKEQVKVQVKEQVSKILPRIEKLVNEQLEAKVLTRSSNESKTSHAIAVNLSKLELKKILIDKIESNKSIHRLDQQKTLYKELINAYETDKVILDTYGYTITIKRRRDDEDDDEEPFAGSSWKSKRRRARKEPESSSAPKEKTSKSTRKSKKGSKSHQKSTGKFAQADEPIHTIKELEELAHQEFNTGFTEDHPVEEASQLPDYNLAQKEDTHGSFNELMDTPLDFSAFMMKWLKDDTLTSDILAGLTFELTKGSCKSLVELEYFLEEVYKATTDQLD